MSRRPVQYFNRMPDKVRSYALSGLTSNADIARVLQRHFDERITDKDVVRWRKQYWRFNQACVHSVDEANMEITNVAYEAAAGGDLPMVRWWLERRNPAFMPKSKLDHSGAIGTLDDRLKSRALSNDEARARGLIYDDDDDGADDDAIPEEVDE